MLFPSATCLNWPGTNLSRPSFIGSTSNFLTLPLANSIRCHYLPLLTLSAQSLRDSSNLLFWSEQGSRSLQGSAPLPRPPHAASLHLARVWARWASGKKITDAWVDHFPSSDSTYYAVYLTRLQCPNEAGLVHFDVSSPHAPPASLPFFTRLAATPSFLAKRLILLPSSPSTRPHILTSPLALDVPFLFSSSQPSFLLVRFSLPSFASRNRALSLSHVHTVTSSVARM